MIGARGLLRRLVRRLPPRAAWALWRIRGMIAAARRRKVHAPEVELVKVVWGASESELEAVVERLVRDEDAPPHHLLVVSDCDAVHVAAARGCRLEYVPPAGDWRRRFPGEAYDAFLAARGRAIRAAYRIQGVEPGSDAPDALRLALEGGGDRPHGAPT